MGKTNNGRWIEREMGCVILCSKCGKRLELCYPDGTEVRRLPYCPFCGAKMIKNGLHYDHLILDDLGEKNEQ